MLISLPLSFFSSKIELLTERASVACRPPADTRMWRCELKFNRPPKVWGITIIGTRTPFLILAHCWITAAPNLGAGEDALIFARRIITGPVPLTLSRDAAYRHQGAELVHLNHPLSVFSQRRFKQDTQTAFSLQLNTRAMSEGQYGFLVALVHIKVYR